MAAVFLFIGMLLFNQGDSLAEGTGWERLSNGIYEQSISSVVVTQRKKVFLSTDKSLYIKSDDLDAWQRLVFLPKAATKINDIAVRETGDDILEIYIATTEGLYRFDYGTGTISHIFKAWATNKKDVQCIKINPSPSNEIYIGTKSGLFVSRDSGKRWKAVSCFKDKKINDILIFDKNIFVATQDGIYKGQVTQDNWIKVLSTMDSEEEARGEEEGSDEVEPVENIITCLAVDIDAKILYAGTNKGVFTFDADGKGKKRLPNAERASRHIEDVLILQDIIVIATKGGVFLYNKKQASQDFNLNSPMSYPAKKLAYDENKKCIYAATTNGLYRYVFEDKKKETPDKNNADIDFLKKQLQTDPNIRQIQKAAIDYAEVSPEKIKWMRGAAKNKAWLPTLGVSFDYDRDNNIDIDRGGTNDTDVFIAGPEDMGWGWGVSMNWDLGDIIWNDDQTSIDVRSRLTAQLRDDVLTEVTTLYFERRRLQQDIVNNAYSKSITEAKILQLQELSAKIDALTDGYLSKCGGTYEEMSKMQQ